MMDLLMVIMGWLAHHLSLLYRIHNETGNIIYPIAYVKSRPYKFILSIIGTIMGTIIVVAQFESSENYALYLTMLAGVGFACDGIADQIGKMVFNRLPK